MIALLVKIAFSLVIIALSAIMIKCELNLRRSLKAYVVSVFFADMAIIFTSINCIYMVGAIFLDGKCPICWLGL